MKKATFTLISFLLLLSFSCEKKSILNPEPPDELPPATMTGENTFGCLVNGEVWRPYTENLWESAISAKHDIGWPECDQLLVSGKRRFTSNTVSSGVFNQNIKMNAWCPVLGDNMLTFSKRSFIDFNNCGEYYLDTLSQRILTITRLDSTNKIASGTFEFTVINEECNDTLRITEGRFDVDSSL